VSITCFTSLPNLPSWVGKDVINKVLTNPELKRSIEQNPTRCTWAELVQKGTQSLVFMDLLPLANNPEQFQFLLFQSLSKFLEFYICIIIDPKLNTIVQVGPSTISIPNTRDCPDNYIKHGTNVGADPCCNETLRATQCCAPRTITFTKPDALTGWNMDKVDQHCKNPTGIKPYLPLFQLVASALDRGVCTPDVSFDIFNEYFRPVGQCILFTFGAVPCSSDVTCLNGQRCLQGSCRSDPFDLATPLINCLQLNLPSDIEKFLRFIWQADNNLVYRNLFLQHFTTTGCVDNDAALTQAECEAQICNDFQDRANCTSAPAEICEVCLKDIFPSTQDTRCIWALALGAPIFTKAACDAGICSNWGIPQPECATPHCSDPCKDSSGNDTLCATEAACNALGHCTDEVFGDGACLEPKTLDPNGKDYRCSNVTQDISIGCVNKNTPQAACTAPSQWKTRAKDATECKNHGQFCYDGKNLVDVFHWVPARWGPGTPIKLTWANTSFINRNKWGTKIRGEELEKLFQFALLKKISYYFKTSLLCMFNPVI